MKIDGGLPSAGPEEVAWVASELESVGYDGALSAETAHDPFLPLLAAAEHTERLELGTGIAVAFARNPMTLANLGYDLHAYSGGRFRLGLGSQIKAHIEKRFSMPWSHPAARMREMILAIRAIWACWNDGAPLEFRGEFYRHTLMTPFFNPGPNPFGTPKIILAAVGERMTEVAGEVADGIILHGFTTERYVREVTMPALERGFARSGRRREDFEISGPLFVLTGVTDEQLDQARTGTKEQIAFYGSTPAVPRCARAPRLGRAAGRAERPLEAGRVAGHGGVDHRRDARDVRRRRGARGHPRTDARAVRRRRGPPQLLRPLPKRPGSLAGDPGGLPRLGVVTRQDPRTKGGSCPRPGGWARAEPPYPP